MNIVITYDVEIRHPEVKASLLKEGFYDRFTKQNDTNTYYLPNTTLVHFKLTSIQEANDIFERVINNLNEGQPPQNTIRVTHFIAFQYTVSLGIPGEPHA